MTDYAGIDYGHGQSNIDTEKGIRYGVIAQNSVGGDALNDVYTNGTDLGYQAALEQRKTEIQDAICGAIDDLNGVDATLMDSFEQFVQEILDCETEYGFDCGDSSGPYLYEEDGYSIHTSETELWVTKSPFYTHAQFCSPCAPGAGNLDTPCESGPKTYCLGEDWFDSDQPCAYPIYRVDNDECVYRPS